MSDTEVRPPNSIKTYPTGSWIDPTNPNPDSIHLIDICHSLSLQGRFAGHTPVLHTVAEHSLEVYKLLVSWGADEEDCKKGLAHDFSEAYCLDMPFPIKRHPHMKSYLDMEETVQEAIFAKMGLSPGIPEIVHEADAARRDFDVTYTRYSTVTVPSKQAFLNLYLQAIRLGFPYNVKDIV